MADNNHYVVAKLEGGRFVAAATHAPYFLFRGDTEEEVIATAERALAFLERSAGREIDVEVTSVARSFTTLRPIRKVSTRQREAA